VWDNTAPELATLADSDWFVVGWTLAGLGSVLAPVGQWTLWLIAGVVVAATVVILLALGRRRRNESDDEPAADASGNGELASAAITPRSDTAANAERNTPNGDGTALDRRTSPSEGGTVVTRPETLSVLAVCGAGMGSSLILRTTAERALEQLGVAATIDHSDIGSARGQHPDVVIGQSSYLTEIGGIAPVVVPITSFVDVKHVRARLEEALTQKGWL
jgi:PTS system ascorbate-specific IIC component